MHMNIMLAAEDQTLIHTHKCTDNRSIVDIAVLIVARERLVQ